MGTASPSTTTGKPVKTWIDKVPESHMIQSDKAVVITETPEVLRSLFVKNNRHMPSHL